MTDTLMSDTSLTNVSDSDNLDMTIKIQQYQK